MLRLASFPKILGTRWLGLGMFSNVSTFSSRISVCETPLSVSIIFPPRAFHSFSHNKVEISSDSYDPLASGVCSLPPRSRGAIDGFEKLIAALTDVALAIQKSSSPDIAFCPPANQRKQTFIGST